MIEKTAQKKIIIVSGGITLMCLLIGIVFIYRPFISRREMLKNKIHEETKRNLYLGQITLLKEHVDAYERRLPEGKSVSWLLDEVSKMALENHLEIIFIKPEITEDLGVFIKLPIRLEANSTYHGLGQFLSQLESLKKFIKVENIQFKRPEENIKEGEKDKILKIRANMLLSSVVLKD